MKHVFFTILVSLLFSSATFAEMQSVNVGGQNRQFYVHAPKGLTDNRPLLISCHGMDQDIQYQRGMAKWEEVADTANFLVVYPGGGTGFSTWDISGDKDVNFILAIIDAMQQKYSIDPNRVYMSGFSMGGMLTYHLMNKIADRIAAFGPVSGYLMQGQAFQSARPIPLIHVHGTSDSVVGYEGSGNAVQGWAKRNGCNMTATTTQYNNGFPNCKKEVWTGGECETEVVRISFSGRDHEHNNSGALHTSREIWNFVKNYSLDCGKVNSNGISFSSPSAGGKYSDGDILPISIKVGGKLEAKQIVLTLDNEPLTTLTSEPWSTEWTAVSGNHVLKAVATMEDNSEMEAQTKFFVNVPQTPYSGTPIQIPGTIEAEDYDLGGEGYAFYDTDEINEGKAYREDGVDIVDNKKGGYAIGYTKSGEWLEYTINVPANVECDIEASASNGNSNFEIELQLDNEKLCVLSGNKTADWDTYSTISTKNKVTLPAGKHIIKVQFLSDYTNLDYVKFSGDLPGSSHLNKIDAEANTINLYPNPAKSSVKVSTPSPIEKVLIMTMRGEVVMSLAAASNDLEINISNLAASNYLIQVITQDMAITKRLIIEK